MSITSQMRMRWYPGRGHIIFYPSGHWYGRMEDGAEIEVPTPVYENRFAGYLAEIGVERTTWSEIMQKAEREWTEYCRVMDAFARNLAQWREVPEVDVSFYTAQVQPEEERTHVRGGSSMQERLTLPDLLAQTREVTHLFDQLVGTWTPAVMISKLAAEVGTLADSVMITEQHRPPRSGEPIDLADDVADVLFMLFRLADHYCIDLQDTYTSMLTSTQERLEQQLASRDGREDADFVLIKPFNKEDFV